eukprot:TRINITY_DN1113_c0_g1_i16.p1 TRINITY_DN1113_c0_g1~~TRINITY_DN1113_c0_g1_i16.p1  ORF type:complete len:234 (+),score=56.99 TRINITY_DN1113_c0_g1_i16:342-1043(+)
MATFYIEQVFRSRTDRPWNFNGTAGVWRRAVIEAVGGWEHDTIVEDSDLSIKCFDAGYRGVYVRDLGAPSELPVSIGDYRSQQTRWVKGMGQVFAKRWRTVLTSRDTNAKQKIEFLFHKLPSLTYLATVVFQLYFPLAIFVAVPFSYPWLGVNVGALAVFLALFTRSRCTARSASSARSPPSGGSLASWCCRGGWRRCCRRRSSRASSPTTPRSRGPQSGRRPSTPSRSARGP